MKKLIGLITVLAIMSLTVPVFASSYFTDNYCKPDGAGGIELKPNGKLRCFQNITLQGDIDQLLSHGYFQVLYVDEDYDRVTHELAPLVDPNPYLWSTVDSVTRTWAIIPRSGLEQAKTYKINECGRELEAVLTQPCVAAGHVVSAAMQLELLKGYALNQNGFYGGVRESDGRYNGLNRNVNQTKLIISDCIDYTAPPKEHLLNAGGIKDQIEACQDFVCLEAINCGIVDQWGTSN